MAHPSQRHRTEPNKGEQIPAPWRKVRSNKGNWYFFNPDTNISVWDLNEYLESCQHMSAHASQEESEFSVKRFKDEEMSHKPQEKHQPEPIHHSTPTVQKTKAKVNPFVQMQSPKVSFSLPVAKAFNEPLNRQTSNYSFAKLENWLKVISKPQNINPLEFITLAHSNFAAGCSSLEALVQNMHYICSISA